MLIFLGIYNIGAYIVISRIDSLIVGVLFVLFGIGAYRGLKPLLYFGIVFWSIGVLLSIADVFLASIQNSISQIPQIFYGVLFLQVGFLWALIKSTPIYQKIYVKRLNKNEC